MNWSGTEMFLFTLVEVEIERTQQQQIHNSESGHCRLVGLALRIPSWLYHTTCI